MLASIHPKIRWQPPVLEVVRPNPGGLPDGVLHLTGKGFYLAPSAFLQNEAMLGLADGDRPVLFYSVPHVPAEQYRGPDALAALLGTSRAAVLAAVNLGSSTGELARRAGISAASASDHARILREAGLISTHRHGMQVRHVLTDLGRRLLHGR